VKHSRSSAANSLSLETFIHWITNCMGQSPSHHTFIHWLRCIPSARKSFLVMYFTTLVLTFIFCHQKASPLMRGADCHCHILLYLQFFIHTYKSPLLVYIKKRLWRNPRIL